METARRPRPLARRSSASEVGKPSRPSRHRRSSPRPSEDKVREASPTLLPAFCPERHINFDGGFCLYWAEVEPLTISDVEAAATWWMKVLTFLKRQQVAAARRQWPARSEARAHGPDAALQQVIVEWSADRLGPRLRLYPFPTRRSSD